MGNAERWMALGFTNFKGNIEDKALQAYESGTMDLRHLSYVIGEFEYLA